jgi:hypothetical protein
MLKFFSTFAFHLGGHDTMHCHCRRHYLPSPEIKRNRLIRLCLLTGAMATAAAWLLYRFVTWACSLPGATRIS